MEKHERKAAIAAYKERKVASGIYSMRCLPTGQVWVGSAADLDTIRNRLWFTLGKGMHPSPALQGAWQEHGEGAFLFEVVEELDDTEDVLPYLRQRRLKAMYEHWLETLDAGKI